MASIQIACSSSTSSSGDCGLPEQFRPSKTFKFPKRKFGKGNEERSFRAEWCEKWKWLHYDIQTDSAFCYICMKASKEGKLLSSPKRDPAYISKGFSYWKEATVSFKKHQLSQCHCEAVEALISLPKQILGNVGEMLSNEHKQEKATNRKMFLILLQNICFLARQGLPLRGHDDLNSNFHQLLLLRSHDYPALTSWMAKKSNKYTSHDIQNECLQIMALHIVRELSKSIRESQCYTIMADECTDLSNKEQFTICIRWVGEDLVDHEEFIGLYQVDNIEAESLTHSIKDTLLRMNVSLSYCRGQCYDGAANMSGCKTGVAATISSEEKRAIFSHCYGHALNLAVGTTIKQSKVCSDAMDVGFEITKLIKYSPKRNASFDKIKEDREDDSINGVGIRSFCPTRWTVRGESIGSIIENYTVLKQLWDECLQESLVPDVKSRIIGIKAQMSSFKLLFGLHLCERILKITDNLSKTLQKESLSAAEAQTIAGHTVQTLKKMRADDTFELFWKNMERLRERTNSNNPELPRKRKAPKWFEDGKGEAYHSPTIEDYYRQQYFEALDLAIASIQDRFNQPGYLLYQNLEELLVRAANSEDFSDVLPKVVTFYGNDFEEEELKTLLEILGSCFTSSTEKVTLKNVLTFLQNLSAAQRTFYKQVCWVTRLILVLPATNAASERSFSTMKRIKSYLRTTMGQSRLNHLMILNVYKELAGKLDMLAVANEFVRGNEYRMQIFGLFN